MNSLSKIETHVSWQHVSLNIALYKSTHMVNGACKAVARAAEGRPSTRGTEKPSLIKIDSEESRNPR